MMHQHTFVPYFNVPLGTFCSELYDMYSYKRDEYDDLQRIRTCNVSELYDMYFYERDEYNIYIYIYIYL